MYTWVDFVEKQIWQQPKFQRSKSVISYLKEAEEMMKVATCDASIEYMTLYSFVWVWATNVYMVREEKSVFSGFREKQEKWISFPQNHYNDFTCSSSGPSFSKVNVYAYLYVYIVVIGWWLYKVRNNTLKSWEEWCL